MFRGLGVRISNLIRFQFYFFMDKLCTRCMSRWTQHGGLGPVDQRPWVAKGFIRDGRTSGSGVQELAARA
jgi:hypothetical protein